MGIYRRVIFIVLGFILLHWLNPCEAGTVFSSNSGKSLGEPRSSEYEYHPVHYASHTTYNPYTIIAFSVFGVLGIILLLQLLQVQTFRSIINSPFATLPTQIFSLSEDLIPELMLRVSEMLEQTTFGNAALEKTELKNDTNKDTRVKRSVSGKEAGIMDWIKAYRMDPNDYQCIRKLACEVLANSNMASRSVKSSLGKTLLSVLGRALEDGRDITSLIQGVIEDPEKCVYLASDNLCDEE